MKIEESLEDEIETMYAEGRRLGKKISPYVIYESSYWKEPREVCVVDEINCLENEAAEVICGTHERNERWIRSLADFYGFTITKEKKEDTLGKFFQFIIRRQL